jgi:para-nitrobenzyl esterase
MISKAISMSGGGLDNSRPGTPLDTAALANKSMMDYFDITTLEEMRALSFDELLDLANKYGDATNNRLRWSPVIDNYFLTGTFSETAFAGEIADIPYMFGFTANDSRDASAAILDFCKLREQQSDKPSYAYLFTRQLPGDENGAFHSSDLWYVFHALRHSWRPYTAGDEALSLQMVDYWTNFAKYGDPNGEDGGVWTPCTLGTPEFMVLDANENEKLCTMSDSPEFLGPSPRR